MFSFLLCGGCSPDPAAVTILFDLRYNDRSLTCDDADETLRLTDFRFYVHNVRLLTEDGNSEIPIQLAPDGIWQNESVALIDLEDASGACLNGSTEVNAAIRGFYSHGNPRGLVFEIGVPESLNHADPMQARAPLAYSEMHWHWASGYKFMRMGVENDDDGFFLHLGSSRCTGTIGDIDGCLSANRPFVELPDFLPNQHRIVIDLEKLIGEIDLEDAEKSECMSGPTNRECDTPFKGLGIDFATGHSLQSASIFHTQAIQ